MSQNKLRVCLTHDVDRTRKSYQYLTKIVKSLKNIDLNAVCGQLKSVFAFHEPYWGFDKIIEIEKRHKVKSTFFFLNEQRRMPRSASDLPLYIGRFDIMQPKIKAIIRKLDSLGWEVGMHGSYESYNDEELLLKEKLALEEILGHKIIGNRQHYLRLKYNHTWNIQKKIGLKYDASFGFKWDVGFKDEQYVPFRPFSDEFMVFPLTIMDRNMFRKKSSMGIMMEKVEKIITIAERNSGVLVLNWHQRKFNEHEYPGYSLLYENIIKHCKKRDASFYRMGDLYRELNST